MKRVACAVVLLMFGFGSAEADPRYPDWPYVQVKVSELSPAALWVGPPLDDDAKARASGLRSDVVALLKWATSARLLTELQLPWKGSDRFFVSGPSPRSSLLPCV